MFAMSPLINFLNFKDKDNLNENKILVNLREFIMHFTATWVKDDAVFDQYSHYENTEVLLNLEICEQEGQYPWARALIKNPRCGLYNQKRYRRIFIMVQQQDNLPLLLFDGYVMSAPLALTGEAIEVIFVAQPRDATQQRQQLQQQLKVAPYWDTLYVPPEKVDDIVEILDARSALLYWSRTGEPLRLTDIFWGSQRVNRPLNIFRDRFTIHLNRTILTAIHVHVTATWTQHYRGRTNISYHLRRLFPGGLINTLTPKSLQDKWWQPHSSLKHSHYWIEESYLQPILAPATGVLGLYPQTSPQIMLSPYDPLNKTRKPFGVALKRQWFRSKLVLGWSYRQKRVEHIKFTLQQRTQSHDNQGQAADHHIRTLNLHLQSLDSASHHRASSWQRQTLYCKDDRIGHQGQHFKALKDHLSNTKFSTDLGLWQSENIISADHHNYQASFFNTTRGLEAVDHALAIARAHLAASARALEIKVEAPFHDVMTLTCDHSIRVDDERLPGGHAWGKVKALRLIVDGESGILKGQLTLGCSIGLDDAQQEQIESTKLKGQGRHDYCPEDYYEPFVISAHEKEQPPTMRGYDDYRQQTPEGGILYPDAMTSHDLIEVIKVINGPEEQQHALQQGQYPHSHNIKSLLQRYQTEIVIRLRDLHPQPKLEHTIYVTTTPWSAPQQINLCAPSTDKLEVI